MKTKKIKTAAKLPKVLKGLAKNKPIENFPLPHYSYSTFVLFCTNPILFKINYINRDRIATTSNISGVIGQAFHGAMEAFHSDDMDPAKAGLEFGMRFLEEYNDGFIEFSSAVKNKQKAQEIFSFAYTSYLKEMTNTQEEILSCEELIETDVDVEWRGERLKLPIKLKGYLDKISRFGDKLKIIDYKVVRAFSDPEKIDGAKIIQAIQYFLLVYAKYGEAPYSIVFEEVKNTRNRSGGPQVKRYEIVYAECEQFFDFFFRLYDDMTRAINGEAVFVPNITTFFDNEVSIVAYIHRLDVAEEAANEMRKMKVANITELLEKKIQNAGSMRKFLASAERKFESYKNLNYNKMKIEEKIRVKLLEHGKLLQFENKVEGHTVDLYRFSPSIGLKMSQLESYVADIEQVIGMSGVRILAPIPDTSLIGFEVPRKDRTFPDMITPSGDFNLAIGVDVTGEVKRFDIRQAPHMLVAGATGSGKSVFLNSLIEQLSQIDIVDLYLFDPKIVELAKYQNQAKEYLTEPEDIFVALDDIVLKMNERYKILSKEGVRNIAEFNAKRPDSKMRYKIVVIDEFGDLTVGSKCSKEISDCILILAQKARAAGIHMIVATQRPSTDIITGTIKANFPTKVAFRTAKAVDSQVLLDEAGAEKLRGKGDMIFASDDGKVRLQGFNC